MTKFPSCSQTRYESSSEEESEEEDDDEDEGQGAKVKQSDGLVDMEDLGKVMNKMKVAKVSNE